MSRKGPIVGGMLVALAVAVSVSAEEPLETVSALELQRYAGQWYEIARLPNRFQRGCAGDVVVRYDLRDDGQVDVLNRCRKADGSEMSAEGVARRAGEDEPTSKLEVRFAPAFLSFIPAVWANYWVIDLAPDYSWAVVGEPRRRYLWILARTPGMEEAKLEELVARASAQGYDTGPLIYTHHSG